MNSKYELLLYALYTLENGGCYLSFPLKSKIQALGLNLRFIQPIFSEKKNWSLKISSLCSICSVQSWVSRQSSAPFHGLGENPRSLVANDHGRFGLHNARKNWGFKARNQRNSHNTFQKSSRSVAEVTSQSVMRSVDFCLESFEHLLRN